MTILLKLIGNLSCQQCLQRQIHSTIFFLFPVQTTYDELPDSTRLPELVYSLHYSRKHRKSKMQRSKVTDTHNANLSTFENGELFRLTSRAPTNDLWLRAPSGTFPDGMQRLGKEDLHKIESVPKRLSGLRSTTNYAPVGLLTPGDIERVSALQAASRRALLSRRQLRW